MAVSAAIDIDPQGYPTKSSSYAVKSQVQASPAEKADFNQPEQLPGGELLWPIKDEQQPEIVHTVEAFMEAALFEPHVDRIVVLPNGVQLLGQHHSIPEKLRSAVSKSSNVRQLLEEISQDDTYRGRIWHYTSHGMEKEVKSDGKSKLLCDKVSKMKEQQRDGIISPNAPVYISELRNAEKVYHPIEKHELVKTSTQIDVYDVSPACKGMPLWERSEGGIFFGERGAGSGFHIDQCMWSNIGRNWCGFKLFAIWPWADRFSVFEKEGVHKGRMFHMPLSNDDINILSQAKKIALLRPGDAFVFSGAQPHTAVVVGDGVNITAFESMVPANTDAVGVLVRSNIKDMHPKMFWMDDDDLDELFEDVVDNLQRTLRDPLTDQRLRSRLQDCVTTMRTRGDAYCKELWKQEDEGKRRRRREESSSSSDSQDGKSQEGSDKAETASTTASTSTNRSPNNFSDGPLESSTPRTDDSGPQPKKARRGGDEQVYQ